MTEDLEFIRKKIGEWLSGPHGSALAAILAAQRGPDSPSEREDMSPPDHKIAYWGRRARKASSGEVIRAASFYGIGRVGCRVRNDDHIVLPPKLIWDHYDKHMAGAAEYLRIKVVEDSTAPSAIKAVWKGGRW